MGQFWLFYLYCTLFCILFDFNSVIVSQWHALSRSEQSKYYELAKKERQLHMQLFPGWSAKDNYVRIAHRQCTMHAHRCLCVRKLGGLLLFFLYRGRWRGSRVSSAEEAFNTSLGSKKTGCRLVKSSTPTVIMTHLTSNNAPNTLERVWPVTVSSSFFCAENKKIQCFCGHLYWEHNAEVMFAVLTFSTWCWMFCYVACNHDDSIFLWVSDETDATVFV